MKLSDLTLIQWLGIVLVINGAMTGSVGEMTDLLGAVWAKHLVSIATIGSGIVGGVITMFGGIGTQARNVVAAGGQVNVSPQAAQALTDLAADRSEPAIKAAPLISSVVVKILIAAFVCSLLFLAPSAWAQGLRARPAPVADPFKQFGDKIKSDIDNAHAQTQAAITGKASDSKAALPCMDISMITRLTPENLVPTMKACVQDLNNQLVTDTQRALDSAKAFSGSATGNASSVGDNDAVNCLTPALALFKAAAIVPAVPAVDAVLNADGSVKTPAVAGTPELDPGPILLYQKYREFTLAGALTSCQAWFNGPINATTSAGVGAIGTAVAGAALLAPK